jgi:Na+-transporting methylmalonyl-CoA/oxaloacetate decarboxylase gamma subunit
MEFNVMGIVVMFLLVIVLVMQIQMSALAKKMDEKEESIINKVDQLIKGKEKEKEKEKEQK